MKVEVLLNPRTWLSRLSLALLLCGTGCGSEVPNAGTQEVPPQEVSTHEAALRPNFQAPFACGQTWTYDHHSTEVRRALDFVKHGGDTNGQPQFASAAGYATRHYEAGGAGNYIKIDHGGGWQTYYFHLSAFSVPDRTQVAQGQQIGVTGSTGASSGPHIHYEQLLNGVGQDIVLNGVSLAPYPSSYFQKSITSNNCPCVIKGDIKAKYDAVNGPALLGACTAGELATPDGVGRYNHFERGSIYWTPTLGAHVVMGQIRLKWEQLGWERSVVGYPITDELVTPDGRGRFNHFERGSIYWTPELGAWEIHGNIREKWKQLGWEKSNLGYPKTGELTTPDGVGRYNHFENGSIYWTQATGAHEVRGIIQAKWAERGWETSYLGYPTTDEQGTADGVGRYNHFQRGSIYFTPATGAHEVIGDINTRWVALGREAGLLGYPLTDETKTPDGVGRFNHFQNGSIYWTQATGAHEVHGPIRAKWESLGWETGALGYPVKDEYTVTGGRESEFQKGFLTLNTATNTVTVRMK
ncbi:peptidase M23-like protein [Archangium gephyra]|uniref:Peptidase M23-like protein n=1 Tax=Archangium gephyra TaxID=48 RepID=A0ABX9KB26_9BACT|nr:peptidoglycan DD-metalloendopeptidase family protein [Archangium gephyra]REG37351.1 peptidase M23-like protein [Archangium gephyra]